MTTVPLSGTNIRLLSGIPFYSDYKHTRWFDSLSEQTNWFLNQNVVHSMPESNFQRIENYNYIAVDQSIDDLWNVNYVMFQNASYNSKWFYAFVTKLEYVQRNRTNVHFHIDVLQTWRFALNFKPSFVLREHCPLWNVDGTPIINTVDEGLNYGTEYDTVKVSHVIPNSEWKWLVIVSKATIHAADNLGGYYTYPAKSMIPSIVGVPQPLSFYLVPFHDNDTTPSVHLPDGSNPPVTKPSELLRGLYLADQAVDNVVGMYVTEYTGIPFTSDSGSVTFPSNNNEIYGVSFTPSDGNTYSMLYVASVWEFESQNFDAGSKYDGFRSVNESKLLMYPYTQTILDDFKGNRVTLKNEYINYPNLVLKMKGSLGISNKTSFGVADYNYTGADDSLKTSVSDEFGLINEKAMDVSIINSYLAAYLQGHKNSLNNKMDSITFNGFMDMLGSQTAAITGAVGGQWGGVAQSEIATQKGLGNTQLQLEAVNAKIKDIKNTPPSISKMGSNTSYILGNKYNGVYVIKKQIKPEYQKKLEDYFHMFGYKKNEVKIPNLHTRQHFNYVQTSSCVIYAELNNDDLQEIKNVFDNGITLWHTDEVGNYDLANGVI